MPCVLEDLAGVILTGKVLPALLPLLARNAGGRPPLDNDPESVLEAPRRRAMYAAIQARPGISVGELSREVNVTGGTFLLHLRRLVAAGLVETREAGRNTFAYPVGSAPKQDAILALEAPARIARLLVEEGPLASEEIGEALDMPVRTVRYNLRRLIAAGYVISKGGAPPAYAATPSLRNALQNKDKAT